MSAAITALPPEPIAPSAVTQPQQLQAPLVSSSPANQSTAAASSGGAAGIVIILLWALGLAKITVPPEVAAALVTLIGSAVHCVVIRYGMPTTP